MLCPYCSSSKSKVVDKRDNSETGVTRRRRECLKCSKRYTTYERPPSMKIEVIKRSGRIEDFDRNKIKDGILRAVKKRPINEAQIDALVDDIEIKLRNRQSTKVKAEEIGQMVLCRLKRLDRLGFLLYSTVYKDFKTIEDLQQAFTELKADQREKDFKNYSSFIKDKKGVSEKKVKAEAKGIGFSDNGIKVLLQRTLWKNGQGQVVETPKEMFKRVAKGVVEAEKQYKTPASIIAKLEKQFYKMMVDFDFVCHRGLKNVGRPYPFQQLAACYVFPLKDDLNYIFRILRRDAFIQKWDSPSGKDFSVLRPRGDIIASTGGRSSGPVSFMTLFDKVSEVISEGSLRRGANMGVLRVDHPDILEFIEAKLTPGVLPYFNVSVGITDSFMKAISKGEEYPLIHPNTQKEVGRLNAKEVWQKIIDGAWQTGEPGLIFLDEMNRKNPTPRVGEIKAVNLCGEQPLLPWESCILGYINLSKFVKKASDSQQSSKNEVDWDRLSKQIHLGVRFLDNTIDVNHYFFKEIEDIVKNGNRKIGLGVMAWADMLIALDIPYNSEEALELAEKLVKFIQEEAVKASGQLAKSRGNFPNYEGSVWEKKGVKNIRNATLTTVAPTGSSSVLLNCSSGIEPVFAMAYTRVGLGKDVKNQEKMFYENPALVKALKARWIYTKELMAKVADQGSVQEVEEIPEEIRQVFVTAMDIEPEWHVKMQAAWQKYIDSAVSKTVNLPQSATREEVEAIYKLAYDLKCKGITVYRDKSRQEQVLNVGKN